MSTVSNPVINPIAGSFKNSVEVTLKCLTPGASIYYTIDGTTPDATKTLYVDGTPVVVASTTTVKAIGIKTGWTSSSVVTSVFTIVGVDNVYKKFLKHTGAGEPFNNALLADVACCDDPFYSFDYGFNYELVEPGATVTITVRGGCPPYTWDVTGSDYSFAEAETSVPYNDLTAIAIPSGDSATITVTDSCGTVVTAYVNDYAPRCAPAVILPKSGTFTYYPSATITSNTPGVSIYYTDDGSDPDDGDNLYSSPFLIVEDTTIKSIAMKSGYKNSVINTRNYVIDITSTLLIHSDDATELLPIVDSSENAFSITNSWCSHDTAQKYFGASSIECYQGYLTLPIDPLFDLEDNDWTFNFWAKATSYADSIQFCGISSSDSYPSCWWITITSGAYAFECKTDEGGATNYTVTGNADMTVWNHLAFVRRGATMYSFLNGVLTDTETLGTMSIKTSPTKPFRIGSTENTSPYDGWFDEFQYVFGSGLWISNFSVPTAPYTK